MHSWMRKPATVVTVLVAAGLAAGGAWATIPDGSGTIHACDATSDKSLRVIDSGGCNKGETPVSWSQNAIQGTQGPQGPQGLQGDTGLQGPPGVTLATGDAVLAEEDPVIGGFFKELSCPTGAKALQGSYEWEFLIGSNLPQADVESFPLGDDSWGFAVGANSTYTGAGIFLFLSCVNAREARRGMERRPRRRSTHRFRRRRAGRTGAGGLERPMMHSASRSVFVSVFRSAWESRADGTSMMANSVAR